MKKSAIKIIIAAVLLAVLAFAFWYGGSSPGARGWTVSAPAAASASPTATPSHSPAPKTNMDGSAPVPTPTPSASVRSVKPQVASPGAKEHACTLSISCAAILDDLSLCDPDKAELVPADGWILAPTAVAFSEGESVFDVLQRVCKQQKIQMEFENAPLYNSAYIEGIGNLYEFDVGELSGWMYAVNGWFPNYGCSRYALKDGDTITWVYTCDQGADVGGGHSQEGG